MHSRAVKLLEQLKRDYLEFSANIPPLRNAHIGTRTSYIYVRKMVVTGNFCLATISFSEIMQGQGVLTAFIEFIKEHPFDYPAVEVECIHNKDLEAKLRREGFVDINQNTDPIAPTLAFPLEQRETA